MEVGEAMLGGLSVSEVFEGFEASLDVRMDEWGSGEHGQAQNQSGSDSMLLESNGSMPRLRYRQPLFQVKLRGGPRRG